ncbi:polysaccharide pyruvyl transferase family protein [Blautia sp.]
MNKTIGLFGVALHSTNYGVTALGISQIAMLESIAEEIECTFKYIIFSGESKKETDCIKNYIPVEKVEFVDIVRIKTGFKGIQSLKNNIQMCDAVIDLTYGDSFSDIYGMKNFVLYSVPKLITEKQHVPLVLGPQTYGPFKSKIAEHLAKKMLENTDYIFARDDESAQQVSQLIPKKRVCVTSDLAMELPYDKQLADRKYDDDLNIGINISNLLWHDGKNFGFKLDYVQFTKQLIEELSRMHNVHLIAHTYDKNDGEYRIAEELHRLYPKTILAQTFVSPIDAKNYISKMDFFIGARMHATIGAFSSGVPIAPIAYSRKFSGLYGSIGYPYIIDCTVLDESEATNKVLEMIENIETYKEKQSAALKNAIQLNRQYRSFLRKKLSE